MLEKQMLTTGEIAKYCGVSFRTVIRWIQRGHLKAIQLPGRGDNRVEIADFLNFLRLHRMAVPTELRPKAAPRILIVDDDANLAASIQRLLRHKEYETLIANDGFHAGALLGSFKPDLVTLDLNMPGISGHEVIRFIRISEPLKNIKILVVSAMLRQELDVALKAGADAVLSKPFHNEELVEKIRTLLNPFEFTHEVSA